MLALVGSGEYLPGMEAVDRELMSRLAEPPRVVCLPTAAGAEGAARIGYWSDLGVAHFTRLGADAHALAVIDRASAEDPTLAAAVAQANFVYLSGGKPDYLYKTLAGSRVWQAILAVLAAGGLLAGCSAGAMILGERFFGFPGWRSGFNFLPGATVVPHFDEIPSAMLRSVWLTADKRLAMVGIDGYTALVVDGERREVLGSGGVTIWKRADKRRYGAGLLPDWRF